VSVARRGVALPLALLALVIIAALIGVGFTVAVLEQRIGRNAMYAAQAGAAAEAGVAATIAGWEGYGLQLLAPGDSVVLASVRLPGGGRYLPTVARLNAALYRLSVEGVRLDAGGGLLTRREVAVILRAADSASGDAPAVRPIRNRAWNMGE
jgi:hypothetical protein